MTWVITARTRFYLHENETLLDGLLRTGHDVNFQCKEGYCGSCRVKVTSSTLPITYADPPPIALVEEGEALTCCCQVKGLIHLKDIY